MITLLAVPIAAMYWFLLTAFICGWVEGTSWEKRFDKIPTWVGGIVYLGILYATDSLLRWTI